MITILEISEACSSPALLSFLSFTKKFLNIVQIVGPILLIVSLTFQFAKLTANPMDKEGLKKIKNSLLATFLLFFIPFFINLSMSMFGESFTFSSCWNSIDADYSYSSYADGDDLDRKSVVSDDGDFQEGIPETPGPSARPLPGTSPAPSTDDSTTGDDASSDSSGLPNTPDGTISGDLQVHFINPNSRVDAIYIKAGDKSMYIDGGFKSDGKREIAYLDKIGVKHIDYYVGTHSHKNHVEAAPAIISKYGIPKVLVARNTCSNSGSMACTWYTIKFFANEQNVSLNGVTSTVLNPGDSFYLGNAKITVLGPISVNNNLARGDTAQNQNSMIFRLDYGTKSFLFTGDGSSSKGFKAIESKFPGKLNVNVLKNAHHNGNDGSSSYSLIKPEYVVFLTKDSDLPDSSLISTIKNNGCKQYYIVTNSKDGNVVFSTDGNTIHVKNKYNP